MHTFANAAVITHIEPNPGMMLDCPAACGTRATAEAERLVAQVGESAPMACSKTLLQDFVG